MATNEPKWETCEIVWRETAKHFFGGGKGYFEVQAIGPKGPYTVRKTDIFSTDGWTRAAESVEKHRNILNALVSELTQDGWEPTGQKGMDWFDYRFRRRVE